VQNHAQKPPSKALLCNADTISPILLRSLANNGREQKSCSGYRRITVFQTRRLELRYFLSLRRNGVIISDRLDLLPHIFNYFKQKLGVRCILL
jgi:hypothetical protein